MRSRINDMSNYLGTALFIVLFMFVIASFSAHSGGLSKDPAHHELVSEWQTNFTKAITATEMQLPVSLILLVSSADKKYFPNYNETFRQFADNRKIAQRFFSLRQTELVIKPFKTNRFYYHLFPLETDVVPLLG